ncbi:restriction endonuclease subunit S [Chelonobacter oris]|uniref:restriction endonuclease subunit S n=1 Tax=Chelonobacter oris TaxID=505317 RepID=UPI002446D1BC|nr:restriction endonuclease subunit S [Chelonobacter oris]
MSYLEKLLNGAEVEWKMLGEVATIYGGLTGKSKSDFQNGNAYYISYKNIFNNLEVDFNNLEMVKILENEKQHKVKRGDVLFTGSSEVANEAGMSCAVTQNFQNNIYLNSFSFGVRFNDDIVIIPEFSKYLFRCYFMREQITKTASGVTRFNVSKERFKKIKIPIPPLDVQRKIVEVLDNFTELTARKKQYEYYRELLLTFDNISGKGGARLIPFVLGKWCGRCWERYWYAQKELKLLLVE